MLLEILRRESLALTEMDLTGSRHGRGRALTTRDIGWVKTSAPMEHGAPTEILLVEIM